MPERTPKSIFMAIILWLVIIGGIAVSIRYFILPKYKEKKQESLALQTGSTGKYKHTVRIAADSFSGYCFLRSPEMEKRLSQQGIKLLVIDDGADYKKRIKALSDGEIELAAFPINSFIQCGAQLGEFPASIVYIIDETKGADAIIAHKNSIANINDLNSTDARIVLTPDSPSEFLARVMIASFDLPNLSKDNWMIKADGSSDVYKKFRGESNKPLFAYAMWEPDVSKALKEQDSYVLIDSSKVQGYIVDSLVVQREFLIENYDVVKSVIESYARTVYSNQHNMIDVIISDSDLIGDSINKTEAQNMVNGIMWKNTLENYAHFGVQEGQQSLENIEDIIIKITDVLVKTGALESNPIEGKINSLYFNKFVEDMKKNNFHPGREINVVSDMELGKNNEQIRGSQKLNKLTKEQWDSLAVVGSLRIAPISFGRGTSRINVQSQHDLQSLANTLNSWPQYYLTVIGRARPGGDEKSLLELAKSRADATVAELLKNGVPTERIRSLAEIASTDSVSSQSVAFIVGQVAY